MISRRPREAAPVAEILQGVGAVAAVDGAVSEAQRRNVIASHLVIRADLRVGAVDVKIASP